MRRLFSRYPSTAKTPLFKNSKQLFIFWTRFLSECAYFHEDIFTYINDFYEYGYDLILVKSNWIWPTLPFSHSPCRFSCFIRSMGAQVLDGPARASSCAAQKQISTGESNFERDLKAPRQTLRRALRVDI